jgi:hypothetical protein
MTSFPCTGLLLWNVGSSEALFGHALADPPAPNPSERRETPSRASQAPGGVFFIFSSFR